MFDLKKRNSLTLNGKEAEEFRRVAVRRRVRGAEASQTVSSEVCGSYTCGQARDRICGSGPKSREGYNTSPDKKSSRKPQVPLKPAHLQSPLSAGPDPASSPTAGQLPPQRSKAGADLSPNRGYGLSVACVSPAKTCLGSPSPTRGGGSPFLNAAHSGPGRCTQGIPTLASSPLLGSPGPGKRSKQSCSPSRGRGHSPARLSPRNYSPLTGKLRTPSPVQGRTGSYSPAKNSKSRLGRHRISKSKMEGQTVKSLTVPDLIICLDENGVPTDKTERSPLRQLQSANCNGSAVPAKAAARLSHTTSEGHLSGKELSLGQTNGSAQGRERRTVNGTHTSDKTEEDRLPTGCGATFSTSQAGNTWDEEDKRREGGGEEPKEENTDQKLFKIVSELLQTERAYVARLHLLDQVFCSRLTEEAGRGSFPAEVIKNIFSNIASIYSFHSRFLLPDLETCVMHWCERPGLGNVLLQHAPFLRMYADYVRNFDQAMELVRTWTERSSAFRNIIQDIQNQEVCGSLTLQHHMLEPVQRVPRYEMLLRDYLKKLPEDNPDYGVAHKCLQTISMAATHSNSAIEKAESRKRLLEIYEMVGEEEVVNPTNELLKEGRLLKLAARNMSAMERHLFLFNNFLLCCTPKFCLVGQRFTVRCRIGVNGMQVQQTTNEDHPYTFQVSGKEKTLELQASSEQDRDEWIKVIQEAITVFRRKNDTFKLASKELNIEQPVGELGRRAPRWIRDNEVTVCMKCQEPFNALTRRRHHCRACGCVVCWKCSDTKVALQYDGNKLNKVCKSCYSILTSRRGNREDGRALESDMCAASGEVVISGFLQYGDNTKTSQRVWSVIARAEPTLLCLFSAPQEAKQLVSIPLLGCSVEDSPQELQGQPCFRLAQSKTTHSFSCESLDMQQRWLAVLKDIAEGRVPAPSLADSEVTANGDNSDGGSSSGEECVANGNQERCPAE